MIREGCVEGIRFEIWQIREKIINARRQMTGKASRIKTYEGGLPGLKSTRNLHAF